MRTAAPDPRQHPHPRPGPVDALGLALAVVGLVLVDLTLDPSWTALVAVGAMALGLGRLADGWLVTALAAGATSWLTALVLAVLSDPWSRSDISPWARQGLALAAAIGLALIAVRRSRHDRGEVVRALAFAEDATVSDALTGLANRRGLALLGSQILESARRRGDAVYCVFVDIDGLSRVNSELGTSAGDEVLLAVAESLRRTTRATDAVARWGDDEFVVVGPGTGLAPLEMERRIRAQCVEHSPVDRRVWQARVSAGGAVLEPWDDGSIETLLRQADREMHLRRALRREAGVPAYRPTRLEPSPQPPHPRQVSD